MPLNVVHNEINLPLAQHRCDLCSPWGGGATDPASPGMRARAGRSCTTEMLSGTLQTVHFPTYDVHTREDFRYILGEEGRERMKLLMSFMEAPAPLDDGNMAAR